MTLFCNGCSIKKYFLIFCLVIPFVSFSRIRWPQVAIPFFCSTRGGMFLTVDTKIFTISITKKALLLNGKKMVCGKTNMYGKKVTINSMYSYSGVYFIVDKRGVSGHFFFNAAQIKNNIREQQMHTLFSVNDVMREWRIQNQIVSAQMENDFLAIAQKTSMLVRVLLLSTDKSQIVEWKFVSNNGFLVDCIDEFDQLIARRKCSAQQIVISLVNGALLCNGKKIPYALRLQPLSGYGECDGIVYDGHFFITPYKNSFLCINTVDLEDYICAVLRTESWPGWPLEVNKVFAIACRSYVASQAFDARRSGRPFHVKNSNAHQTYRGKHDVAVLKKAVQQTRGIVLGFDKKPILAMFDSCCGGVIPAHVADFDFKKAPYLARTYACTYCKKCSLYSWQVSYTRNEFHDICKSHEKNLKVLQDVVVIKKDKAGLVLEVKLKSRNAHFIISGKKLYSLLKGVKSFHFDIVKKSGEFIVCGKGLGHHLGLCQWGAREMVRDGWDYKSILMFYYPQTHFMRLR